MAGFFGEGVKVEINQLMSTLKSEVTYWTAGSVWRFFYEQNAKKTEKVLCVCCDRLPPNDNTNHNKTETHITLHNLRREVFDPSLFLFLRPSTKSIRSPVVSGVPFSGLEVLIDPLHRQRVYAHGIYIKKMPEFTHFGLNYYGSMIPELKINRDRSSLEGAVLLRLLPFVFHCATTSRLDSALLYEFSHSVYHTLKLCQGGHDSFFQFVPILFHKNDAVAVKTMSNCLLEVFKREEGHLAIPSHKDTTESKQKEAEVFGAKLVMVEEILLQWLRFADNCPSLEGCWGAHAAQVFQLEEYLDKEREALPTVYSCPTIRWPSDAEAVFALSLRTMVDQLFAPHVSSARLRFKNFGGKETRRLINLRIQSHNRDEVYHIVNPAMFNSQVLHEELKKTSPDFICMGGRCGCIRDALIEDILETFPPEMRKHVERSIRRKCLSNLETNLMSLPSPQRSTSTSTIPPQSGSTPQVSHQDTLNMDSEEDESITYNLRHGVSNNILQMMTDTATHCKSSTANPTIRKSLSLFSYRCAIDQPDALHLRQLIGRFPYGIKVFVSTANPGVIKHPLQNNPPSFPPDNKLEKFTICIALLARHVFQLPSTEKVNLCWEDSQRIAFNCVGQLFFNLAYFESIYDSGCTQVENSLDFWFSTFCHELAHNSSYRHDEKHVFAMTLLVSAHVSRYRLLLTEIGTHGWEKAKHICDHLSSQI